MPRALIIIPAYNEETALPVVIRTILALDLPVERDVLVVDDGSHDRTAAVAREAGARSVSLAENLGYGNALRTGYLYAHGRGYDWVVQLDGDGQHAPESIPALLQPLLDGVADLVVGSRFHDSSSYAMSATRRTGQRFFTRLMVGLGGIHVNDVTSGFQALGPKALALYTSEDFPSDYPDANVLLFAALHGLRIREVPAEFRERAGGVSMHRGVLRPAYYIYKMVFSMLLIYARHRRAAKGVQTP